MFLIDIQPDQADGIRRMLDAGRRAPRRPGWSPCSGPVSPASAAATSTSRATRTSAGAVRWPASTRSRIATTSRERDVTRGTVLGRGRRRPTPEQEVSIEQSIHERFGIDVGDRMRFDVARPDRRGQGHERARGATGKTRGAAGSCSSSGPGALAQAPHTFVGFVRGPAATDARARLQHDIVSQLSQHVSAIDARDVIARIQAVVDNVVLAISIVGGIALASGVLILVGAVAMTKFQRVYEAAILRTLGASTRLLTTMVALEYSALGLLAGLIGAFGALALSWAVSALRLRHRVAAGSRCCCLPARS